MNVRFLATIPVRSSKSPERGSSRTFADSRNPSGRAVKLDANELESTNFRMLASSLRFRPNHWVIPKEQPIQLLFLRNIFTRLREQEKLPPCKNPDEEKLSFEAFQQAFERLFFLLQDPVPLSIYTEYDVNGDGEVSWEEFFHVYRKRKIMLTLSLCERIFLTLDNPDPSDSSYLSHIVSIVVLLTILVSSCCFIFSTMPNLKAEREGDPPYISGPSTAPVFEHVDLLCLLLFVLEYVTRLATCWCVRSEIFDKARLTELVTGYEPISLPSPALRLVRFIFAPSNLIDLAAILPAIISQFVESDGGGGFVVLRLIRLTRIFRVFKTPAIKEPVIVIARTVQQCTKALYVLLFNLLLGVVIFGSLMYLAEGQGQWDPDTRTYRRKVGMVWISDLNRWEDVMEPSPFTSIPHSFWWAMVTVATVGYGDQYPTTNSGYVIAVVTMLFGLVILALPVGVIGGTFNQVWESYMQEKDIEAEDTRHRMRVITSAMQRLDPSKMSNLMLMEIWNEQDGSDDAPPRSAPANFMGEAKLELDLPLDKSVTKTITLPLQENLDIVKRSVSGKVTVRYHWSPTSSSSDAEVEVSSADAEVADVNIGAVTTGDGRIETAAAEPKRRISFAGNDAPQAEPKRRISFAGNDAPQVNIGPVTTGDGRIETAAAEPKRRISFAEAPQACYNLLGRLQVTVVSADHLLNLDCTRQHCTSTPYCLVLVYPTRPAVDGALQPCVWRTPSLVNTLNPKWDASYCFEYDWTTLRTADPKPGFSQSARSSKSDLSSSDKPEASLDIVLTTLQSVGSQLKHLRQEVRTLSARVDRLSESRTDGGMPRSALPSGVEAGVVSCQAGRAPERSATER